MLVIAGMVLPMQAQLLQDRRHWSDNSRCLAPLFGDATGTVNSESRCPRARDLYFIAPWRQCPRSLFAHVSGRRLTIDDLAQTVCARAGAHQAPEPLVGPPHCCTRKTPTATGRVPPRFSATPKTTRGAVEPCSTHTAVRCGHPPTPASSTNATRGSSLLRGKANRGETPRRTLSVPTSSMDASCLEPRWERWRYPPNWRNFNTS
jgi:hypothetical protein